MSTRLSKAILVSARACLFLALGCSNQGVESETNATSSNASTGPSRDAGGAKSFSVEAATSPKEARASKEELAEWGTHLKQLHAPKEGCYQASYPDRDWTEVACLDVQAPLPQLPAQRSKFSVQFSPSPAGPGTARPGIELQAAVDQNVYTMEGSFWLLDHLTEIYGPRYGTSCSDVSYGDDYFGYQLNSNLFHDPNCVGGMKGPACGWQQFAFNNQIYSGLDGWKSVIFIESWLLGQPNCPPGWTSVPVTTDLGSSACTRYGGFTPVAHQTYQDLANTTLQGTFDGTNSNVVLISQYGASRAVSGAIPSFPGQWTQGEFNIYGSACGGTVQIPGAVLGTQVKITSQFADYHSIAAPTPINEKRTGEGNGMTILPESLCPLPGAAPDSDDQGSVRGLEMSADAKRPSIPFCLLNDTTGISQPLW